MAVDINPIPRFPVFTPRQAAAYAQGEVGSPDKDYKGMCLHFSAWVYGFSSSGVYDAASFWRGTPRSQKSPGDRRPPVGGLACWTGGSSGHGHISPVVGYSRGVPMIATNDLRRSGRIDVAPLGEVEAKWGQKYEGWTKPYFPFGVLDDRRPPAGVYESKDAWGHVYQSRLVAGQRSSDSVRKLQRRLGCRVTGTYNKETVEASARWQQKHGRERADGTNWTMAQLNLLAGSNYFVHRAA